MKTKEAYAAYLITDHWVRLRARVIERDGRKCTRCPSRERLQAHHLIYRSRWEDAQLSDLVTLCRPCHEKEHGLTPSPEPQSDYVSQIFTIDQLCRARNLNFITQQQFDLLRPKFEPAKPVLSIKRKKNHGGKKFLRAKQSFDDKWRSLQRQLQSEKAWRGFRT